MAPPHVCALRGGALMAVAAIAAEPIDRALDELARTVATPVATVVEAMHRMSLWHFVFASAMTANDVPLAILAAREWRNAKRAIALLEAAPP